jgi:hypothetical protein
MENQSHLPNFSLDFVAQGAVHHSINYLAKSSSHKINGEHFWKFLNKKFGEIEKAV